VVAAHRIRHLSRSSPGQRRSARFPPERSILECGDLSPLSIQPASTAESQSLPIPQSRDNAQSASTSFGLRRLVAAFRSAPHQSQKTLARISSAVLGIKTRVSANGQSQSSFSRLNQHIPASAHTQKPLPFSTFLYPILLYTAGNFFWTSGRPAATRPPTSSPRCDRRPVRQPAHLSITREFLTLYQCLLPPAIACHSARQTNIRKRSITINFKALKPRSDPLQPSSASTPQTEEKASDLVLLVIWLWCSECRRADMVCSRRSRRAALC
jgi:hypothetical protein